MMLAIADHAVDNDVLALAPLGCGMGIKIIKEGALSLGFKARLINMRQTL